jgi:hypothetical protein
MFGTKRKMKRNLLSHPHTTLENREAQPVDTICNLQKQPILFGQHLHSLMYSSPSKSPTHIHKIAEIESLKHQWWVLGI